MKFLMIPVVIVVLSSCFFLDDDKEARPTQKEEAKKAFEEKDYKTSIDKYSSAYEQDSTDTEAYLGLVHSYVELMEPDSLLALVEKEPVSPMELLVKYTLFEENGYFDSLDVLNELIASAPSSILDSLTLEERVELESIRVAAAFAGSMDELVKVVEKNPEALTKILSGEIDEEMLETLFTGQDSVLINRIIENIIKSGYMDSLETRIGK